MWVQKGRVGAARGTGPLRLAARASGAAGSHGAPRAARDDEGQQGGAGLSGSASMRTTKSFDSGCDEDRKPKKGSERGDPLPFRTPEPSDAVRAFRCSFRTPCMCPEDVHCAHSRNRKPKKGSESLPAPCSRGQNVQRHETFHQTALMQRRLIADNLGLGGLSACTGRRPWRCLGSPSRGLMAAMKPSIAFRRVSSSRRRRPAVVVVGIVVVVVVESSSPPRPNAQEK